MPAAATKGEKKTFDFKAKRQENKDAISKTKTSDYNKLFIKRPKNFRIGGDKLPKGALNLYRYVRWPKYVRIQRQKRVLMKRFKVPPTINQFTKSADKQLAYQVMSFLNNYRPEEKQAKKQRLRETAEKKSKGEKAEAPAKKSPLVFGVNEVVKAVEKKQARLVVIAHDVDPIELVVYLPALCKKLNVPYCIVKSKSRIGALVNQKTTSCVALTDMNKGDRDAFGALVESIKGAFNDRYFESNKKYGGNELSNKSKQQLAKKKRH